MALGAITWEPQIHAIVVVLLALVILPGSVYLVLATDLGARIGFLVAAAGFFGWMSVMAFVWTVYGIGPRGTDPSWKVKEVVVGDASRAATAALNTFPSGWKKLPPGDPEVSDAQATVDAELTGTRKIFSDSSKYLTVSGYEKGGQKYEFFRHRPHYAVIQVQGAVAQQAKAGGAPPKPEADATKPVVTILLIRDLGSLRLPSAVISFASFIIFAVTIYVLHRRDKVAMAARAA